MYEPSVTAIHELSLMGSAIQLSVPTHDKLSHIHIHFHFKRTSCKFLGAGI
jgi:hypothetical protein